ncbi:serine-rich adhesin for platelets isoform X2 [Drosophila rhopaloa]|nr:serine-rich adhesin for platelets isoform X2 [Drosophila rhopaloa]
MTTTNSSNSSTTSVTTQQQKEQIGSTTSKVYIKKTGSSSNSTSSSTTTASSSAGRKESFGSRDSLNDILSETGLPTGNVAAQRKSLENKNLDLTKPPGVGAAVAINQQRSSTSSATTSSATTISTGLTSSSVSKSTESMDEKVKSPPPPVLSKKPSVPLKKTPTGGVPVTAVGNLLSGKKKNPEGKLTTAVSHDLADGLTASKMLSGANQLPESGAPGNLVIRRAATIAVEDTDFDRVERASILTDMRQGRVKAPKRRPPSAAINVLGESNNNSVYVNGSGMGGGSGGAGSASELSEDGGAGGKGTAATASSDDNSTGEEPQLAKPKPREWEKKKAPWMEELKASQVTRKKTPSVEPRGASVAERTSKLFAAEQAISSSSSSTTTKVQSSAVTSSMFVENSTSSSVTTSSTSTTTNDAIMSRSLTAAKATAASSDEETRATRPNSLAIRNQRSVSPLVKSSNASSAQSQEEKPTNQLNNHQDASSSRVNQLEQRVDKLEGLVLNQQRTIEELVNALKSEAERVKILRSELDKYAQCVTQV